MEEMLMDINDKLILEIYENDIYNENDGGN